MTRNATREDFSRTYGGCIDVEDFNTSKCGDSVHSIIEAWAFDEKLKRLLNAK